MMSRFLLPFILSIILCSYNAHAQDCSVTKGSLYGSQATNERGYCLEVSPGGNSYYVVGLISDSILLFEVDLTGAVLWSREIDMIPNLADHVSSMIVDSEGMLAFIGIAGSISTGGRVFAFRYDPSTHQVLWAKEYDAEVTRDYSNTILQKGIGGNYVVSTNPHNDPKSNNDCQVFELDKNTGEKVPEFSKNYHLGNSEAMNLVYDGNFIYGVGRFTAGPSNAQMRNTIVKLNPEDGTPVWVRMGHIPLGGTARLYGVSMVIDSNEIISGYHGDPAGTSTSSTKMYLQKTDLNGNLIWLNQYELPGSNDVCHAIIKSGDGYVVLAGQRAPTDRIYLFKVDTDGAVLWSNVFEFASFVQAPEIIGGLCKLIQIQDNLVFTGYATNSNGSTDIILVKTNLDGESDNACATNEPVTIPVTQINNPSFVEVGPIVTPANHHVEPLTTTVRNVLLDARSECFQSDTIFTTIDTLICAGQSFEGYTSTGEYEDEFETANGCDSIRTINLTVIGCNPIIHYDLEACESYMHNGSHMIFTEFVPDYPTLLSCADVEANHVDMEPSPMSKHSCTPGVNGTIAMCIGASPSCTYNPGDVTSLIISFSVDIPDDDSVAQITGFEFFEKAPTTYSWIDGPSGPNNYPRFYGIRILRNGTVIFQQSGIATTGNWTLQRFDYLHDSLFTVHEDSDFRIELLPYCPIGNGAEVSAWDIDEITIFGGCYPFMTHSIIAGDVVTKSGKIIPNTYLHLADNSNFELTNTTKTNTAGQYVFDDLRLNSSYYIKGYNNGNVLQGVSTLDLIRIQRHLIGVQSFSTLHQYIAADINHNGSVSTLDMVELRKMLLGYYDEFPKNTSWRFGVLPQDFAGTDISAFMEVGIIEALQDGITIINFEGIKIGDVNEDIKLNLQGEPINIRNADMITFHINNAPVRKGDLFTMEVTSQNIDELQGFQLALMCNDLSLVSVQGAALPVSDENISFSNEGLLRISWNHDRTYLVLENEVLFTITFTASSAGMISDKISVQQHGLQPEVYTGSELKAHELIIEFERPVQQSEINSLRIEPNPLTTQATLKFTLSTGGVTVINFFDLSGKLVYSIQKEYPAGDHTEHIQAKDLLSVDGVIYCQLVCNGYTSMQKLVLLK